MPWRPEVDLAAGPGLWVHTKGFLIILSSYPPTYLLTQALRVGPGSLVRGREGRRIRAPGSPGTGSLSRAGSWPSTRSWACSCVSGRISPSCPASGPSWRPPYCGVSDFSYYRAKNILLMEDAPLPDRRIRYWRYPLHTGLAPITPPLPSSPEKPSPASLRADLLRRSPAEVEGSGLLFTPRSSIFATLSTRP